MIINDYLNLINDEYEVIYSNICGELLELGKELTDKHEATFLSLKINIQYGNAQVDLIHKFFCS